MAFEKIIVVDDEMIIRKTLQEHLRKKRYIVATAKDIKEARALLDKDSFDLMLVDIQLPDGDGKSLLDVLDRGSSAPMIMMMTGDGSVQSAVECMRGGAFDYIMKPFDMQQIEMSIKRAEGYNKLVKVNRYLSEESPAHGVGALIGDSGVMQNLRDMLKKVAVTEATVLISGENGTGKEMIAHELYRMSSRAKQPYIKVNCAAISETLIESEFFGHEKGAFTGATQRREGRFELADGGTLLLDEISEVSLRLQAKLLRVLQEKEFERVGGNKTIQADVRVLATTNRNLFEAVEKGDFREDLFYRLNVFPVQVPALRDRGNDVQLLAEEFLARFSRKHGRKGCKFSKGALKAIVTHYWPGNVRELQNTIERAVILSDEGSAIEEGALGLIRKNQSPTMVSLEEIERQHILDVLSAVKEDRAEAAQILGITNKQLSTKIKQLAVAEELMPA